MGLDMYLEGRVQTYAMDGATPSRQRMEQLVAEENLPLCDNLGYVQITFEAAYWRKANQVHGWFVGEVQNDVDDCGTYHVPHAKLTELRNLCRRAVAERNSTLLMPRSGFFFGGTDIDEWYWGDLERTAAELTKLTEHPRFEDIQFYYHSSW